jgi:hypothetical protein
MQEQHPNILIFKKVNFRLVFCFYLQLFGVKIRKINLLLKCQKSLNNQIYFSFDTKQIYNLHQKTLVMKKLRDKIERDNWTI